MAYGMAGMPGNQRQIGLPRGMSGFPVVGRGLGGLPVRVTGPLAPSASYITTPTATPGAFGNAFEGGFYTGMLWNELVQSGSSAVIGTGSKFFVVADMTATPLVYAGQTLEVRSRANPANKMIGVVIEARGTALTIEITSVSGAGIFSDWSVMARYRVIVAPKTTGENSSIAYKNASTFDPAACSTLTEGFKATLAMVGAGSSTVYPAAHWCRNLSISGFTDWYLPSRDELHLCWRNLKPSTANNRTSVDRTAVLLSDYMNLGSYGDDSESHGVSNNTLPVGVAYTLTDPSQVVAGKGFRTGEAEAFSDAFTVSYYSSSSDPSVASRAWKQSHDPNTPGAQALAGKENVQFIRAVRRSII